MPRFSIRLPYRRAAGRLSVFAEAHGFLEAEDIRAEGEGFIRFTLTGQAVPGSGGLFGPVRLTYGEAGASFERMIEIDHAPMPP